MLILDYNSCIHNYLVDHITGQILGPQQRMIVSYNIERKLLRRCITGIPMFFFVYFSVNVLIFISYT